MKSLTEYITESLLMEAGPEAKKANKLINKIKNTMKSIAKDFNGMSKAQPMRWEAPIIGGKSLDEYRSSGLVIELALNPENVEWTDEGCQKVFNNIVAVVAKAFNFDIKGEDANIKNVGGGRGFQWTNGMYIHPDGSLKSRGDEDFSGDYMKEVISGKFAQHDGDVHVFPYFVSARAWDENPNYTFNVTVGFDIIVENIQ